MSTRGGSCSASATHLFTVPLHCTRNPGVICGLRKEYVVDTVWPLAFTGKSIVSKSSLEQTHRKIKKKVLTPLHPHGSVSAIDAFVALRLIAHLVISVDERVRHRAIVFHGEMVNTLAQAVLVGLQLGGAAHVPLERDFGAAFDLVVEALARVLPAVQHDVVVEGRDGVFWDRGVGKLAGLELRGAAV